MAEELNIVGHFAKAIGGAIVSDPRLEQLPLANAIGAIVSVAKVLADNGGVNFAHMLSAFLPVAEPDEESALAMVRAVYAASRKGSPS